MENRRHPNALVLRPTIQKLRENAEIELLWQANPVLKKFDEQCQKKSKKPEIVTEESLEMERKKQKTWFGCSTSTSLLSGCARRNSRSILPFWFFFAGRKLLSIKQKMNTDTYRVEVLMPVPGSKRKMRIDRLKSFEFFAIHGDVVHKFVLQHVDKLSNCAGESFYIRSGVPENIFLSAFIDALKHAKFKLIFELSKIVKPVTMQKIKNWNKQGFLFP
jgi:hypothetical protein